MAYTVGQSGVANYANTTLSTVTSIVANGGIGAGGVTIVATPPFTPGNALRTTSGTFAVPSGTTNLVIEIWGGGGGGGTGFSYAGSTPQVTATAGTDSTIISPVMRAKGGNAGSNGADNSASCCCLFINGAIGGVGGTLPSGSTGPSGSVIASNIQVKGANGGNNNLSNGDAHGGAGHNGFIGNGGLAGIGGAQVATLQNGIDATNYAAAGSGSGGSSTGGAYGSGGSGGGGGCAGGYVRYTLTSGIPPSITFTVGAKGVGAKFNGTFPPAGDGSNGVVRFTYS